MGNDRVKRAERASARAAEQVFRTRELMPSDPVAVSVEGCQKRFHLFRCKRHKIQDQLGSTGKDGCREGGVRDTIF